MHQKVLTETKLISTLNEENLPNLTKTIVPTRLLLGPGPSNAHPEVLKALSLNPIGHLDEAYLNLMSDVQNLFKQGKRPLLRKCCLHIIDC